VWGANKLKLCFGEIWIQRMTWKYSLNTLETLETFMKNPFEILTHQKQELMGTVFGISKTCWPLGLWHFQSNFSKPNRSVSSERVNLCQPKCFLIPLISRELIRIKLCKFQPNYLGKKETMHSSGQETGEPQLVHQSNVKTSTNLNPTRNPHRKTNMLCHWRLVHQTGIPSH
jgi:hypothetical protein